MPSPSPKMKPACPSAGRHGRQARPHPSAYRRGRQSRRWLKEIFRRENFQPKKSLGQHFLTNYRFLDYIAGLAEIRKSDLLLEIGAGTGALTAVLAEREAEILAVEIDPLLCQIARKYLQDYDNIDILEEDILKGGELNSEVIGELRKRRKRPSDGEHPSLDPESRDEGQDAKRARDLKVIGNLPFNIASATILALLSSPLPVKLMLFTVQEEVAHRLASGPARTGRRGSKDYGLLSLMAQVHSEIEVLRRIPASAFWPEPEVKSRVVRLVPTRVHLKKILDQEAFTELVKALFTWRRKTIKSSLLRALPHLRAAEKGKAEALRLLKSADIDPKLRPEDLSLDQFIRLSNLLTQACLPPGGQAGFILKDSP